MAIESVWTNDTSRAVGTPPVELVGTEGGFWNWTTGATESNALVLGALEPGAHLVTSAVEHASIHKAPLEDVRVTRVPVDGAGRVDPDDVQRAITADTALISIMHINNEVGAIQPLAEIGAIARKRGIPFHTDAAQSPLYFDVPVDEWALDYVSFSPHKFHGPKGIGLLWCRRDEVGSARAAPAYLVCGASAALDDSRRRRPADTKEVTRLRARLWEGLRNGIPKIILNGPPLNERHPGNLHVSIAHVSARSLVRQVGAELAISSGSACASSRRGFSHVLKAMSFDDERMDSSIRLCVGRETNREQIDRAVQILVDAVAALRSRSPLWRRETSR